MESGDLAWSVAVAWLRVRGSTHPSHRGYNLTSIGRGLIDAPMLDAVTSLIVRRRRTSAVWAEICV